METAVGSSRNKLGPLAQALSRELAIPVSGLSFREIRKRDLERYQQTVTVTDTISEPQNRILKDREAPKCSWNHLQAPSLQLWSDRPFMIEPMYLHFTEATTPMPRARLQGPQRTHQPQSRFPLAAANRSVRSAAAHRRSNAGRFPARLAPLGLVRGFLQRDGAPLPGWF